MTAVVVDLRSIQAERLEQTGARPRVEASFDETEEYLAGAPEGTIICRSKGRHDIPPLWVELKSGAVKWRGQSSEGYLIREAVCRCCGIIRVVEHYEVYGERVVQHGRRRTVSRIRLVRRRMEGYREEHSGFVYAMPKGSGFIVPKVAAAAAASGFLAGMTVNEIQRMALESAEANAG